MKNNDIELTVNGTKYRFNSGISLEDIIKSLGIMDKVMAAAVNMEIVKKEKWLEFIPEDGDSIELLNFVGGG